MAVACAGPRETAGNAAGAGGLDPGGGAGSAGVVGGPGTAGTGAGVGASGAGGAGVGAGGTSAADGGGLDAGPEAGVADSNSVITEPSDDAAWVFDQTKLRTYEITLSAGDLASIDQMPSAEQYVVGSVTVDGEKVDQVGVRYKGSVGAFLHPCTSASIGQTPGQKSGKCSIKLAFDHLDPAARFHGLRKVNLHSMNLDPSLMRDRLGYAMFRQFDVPAPRAVHARVLINGKLEGLFAVVEQVDGRFTRSRFGEGGEGNLYKEIWPIHTDAQAYLDALETNEDQMPSVQRMLDFHAAIGGGLSSMEAWVDREMTLRYIAADRVMINDDGAFHWWCAQQGQGNNPGGKGNHNYYWYEAEHANRFWIIPWDMDNALAGSDFVHISPEWTAAGSCLCLLFASQIAASCDPLISLWAQWKPDYESAVDQFLAGPFAQSNVDALLSAWEMQIASAVTEAAGKNGAPSTMEWQTGLSDLRSAVGAMRTNEGYAY